MAKSKRRKSWTRDVIIYALLSIVLAIAVDVWRTKDMPTENAPPLSGITLSGEFIDAIEMSKNTPVIVYFWATWCAACKFVTPTIDWFNQSYQVIGVSLNSGENRRVSRYMDAHDYQFSNINDVTGDISKQWGILVTPTIIIIDKGEVKTVTTGVTTPWGLLARLWLTKI
ncbi:protein disulfide oxidoreductase [Vibrio sp. TRT 21S02]|uniref:protein disulfide oxidoreductase n=1 Tax=Vibrio sp. TRT 21S02 TaxID=3418507 RepID=UPI003CF3FE58